MRFAPFLRHLPLLLLLAFVGTALPACGGGGPEAELPDHQGPVGTVTVLNQSGGFMPFVRLVAANGAVTASNVANGGSALFTNVAHGHVTATGYAANGVTELAGASGTLSSSSLTLTFQP
jgi:hypothetical protein